MLTAYGMAWPHLWRARTSYMRTLPSPLQLYTQVGDEGSMASLCTMPYAHTQQGRCHAEQNACMQPAHDAARTHTHMHACMRACVPHVAAPAASCGKEKKNSACQISQTSGLQQGPQACM